MTCPLVDIVALLQPAAPFSKVATGAGAWHVRRTVSGKPFYCVVLEGSAQLAADDSEILSLQPGDFVLIPAADGFTMSSTVQPVEGGLDPETVTLLPGETRHGNPEGPVDVRVLVGHFEFGSPDNALLVSLLPRMLHIRGEERLTAIVKLVTDEARADRPGRDIILSGFLEIMLLEALRASAVNAAPGGLLCGLADRRLSGALRQLHEDPAREWTVEELAKEAAMSRSAFFNHFRRAMGVAPMEYLLSWRMALAKNLLRSGKTTMQEIADRIGYGSASAFSTAFTRFVGVPPSKFAEQDTAVAA